MSNYIIRDTASEYISKVDNVEVQVGEVTSSILDICSTIQQQEDTNKRQHRLFRKDYKRILKKVNNEQKCRVAEIDNLKSVVVTKLALTTSQEEQDKMWEEAYNNLHDNMMKQMNWRFWLSIAFTALIGIALLIVIQFA